MIVPVILSRLNRCKGCIDKMTRYLRVKLTLFSAEYLLSRCWSFDNVKNGFVYLLHQEALVFPQICIRHYCLFTYTCSHFTYSTRRLPPKGEGFQRIQLHLWSTKSPFTDVVYSLATTYKILDPLAGDQLLLLWLSCFFLNVEDKEADVELIGTEIQDNILLCTYLI